MTSPLNVAVIGGGISGIAAAWTLHASGAHVQLFEASDRLGGHTHTHSVPIAGGHVRVDTGFIVFNEFNYPNFSAWLETLGVAWQLSDMSFAVRDDIDALEYGTTDLAAIFSNVAQLARPSYWRMWWDLLRFYRQLDQGAVADVTLGEFLRDQGYSRPFIESHIAPMCSALWSQPAHEALRLSLPHVVGFMRNHRMLNISGRPSWRVLENGSDSYLQPFRDRFSGQIHLATPIEKVARMPGGVRLNEGEFELFDAVIVACHSDQALSMLEQPTELEASILGAIPYRRNEVVLHSDASFMPSNRKCWSSWNVVRECDGAYTITYWMNKLQNLSCSEDFFVTLNPQSTPREIHWQGAYEHPHFTKASASAQMRWAELGDNAVLYAGAYWHQGFHEDGFVSGVRAADALLAGQSRRAA